MPNENRRQIEVGAIKKNDFLEEPFYWFEFVTKTDDPIKKLQKQAWKCDRQLQYRVEIAGLP